MTTTQERTAIDPATRIGFVSLTVSDLDRSLPFYTDLLGFALLQRTDSGAVLGVGDTLLLILTEDRGAAPWTEGYTGLHHFAVLLPTRGDLGRLYRRLLDHGYQPIGEDHNVSEAMYFDDPDNHRIEVYRDRAKDRTMGSHAFDADGLLAEAEAESRPWQGLPSGTRIGHMHLRVGDIQRAKDFYHGVLGFDVMSEMPDALFISAGGYHHHLGLNTWLSKGASAPPPHLTGLRFFTVDLPDKEALDAVLARVGDAGLTVDRTADGVTVRDPWDTAIVLRPTAESDVQAASTLETGA